MRLLRPARSPHEGPDQTTTVAGLEDPQAAAGAGLHAAVDEVRRSLVRKLTGRTRVLIKGTRFVLLNRLGLTLPLRLRRIDELAQT